MMINVEVQDQILPLLAPIGAAGYYYEVRDGVLSVLFAMMRQNERGIDALKRVRSDHPNVEWMPCAARPEEQHHILVGSKDFVAFDFTYQDGMWRPKNVQLNEFMSVMSRLAAEPHQAPEAAYTDMASWASSHGATPTTK
jgi:hypothetical protein